MVDRAHPRLTLPVDTAGDPVADGLYGLVVAGGKVTGLGAAESDAGSPTITYGQTGKTFTIARTSTSGSTWSYMLWTVAHYQYFRINSFAFDVHTADTYTLSIDGEDVGSVVAGSGAGTPATITLSTPKVLTPGPHTFKLRGTAARSYYYNSGNAPTPTGTYIAKLAVSPWLGPNVVAAVPGTLNFDAEGVAA